MEFRILGPLEVRDGERLLPLGGARRRAVLALLLLDANRVVSVEQIVDGVWGDAPPSSALASLQNHLGRLRRELGERLVTRAPGYLLRVADTELDLDRFLRLVDEAQGAEPVVAAGLLAEGLALWRGPPLADLAGEPVARAAAHLEELRLAALEERLEADLALGRHTALVPELEELVGLEPFRERPRRQLIVALYRSGRQADALEAYTQARRAFVDELGTEPGRELQEVQRAVLRRDPALDAPERAERPTARPTRAEERKTVTVLAADVASDDLSDDPEARRAELRERSAAAERVLETHGATVQSEGSGLLLGAFGAPAARDDDALQAARAAVALGSTARVGLATGEVVTGEPLVSGPPVEAAVSLRDRAAAGQVLAGFRTWRLVRHAVTAHPRDGSWVVESVDPEATPVVRRLETPIVGRERELEHVVGAFERAVSESRPHLVTVFGSPGIGKTRLAIECTERLASVATSAFGRCRSSAQESPYLPLRELLAGLARGALDGWIREGLEPDADGARLATWLGAAVGTGAEPGRPEETAWAARRLLARLAEDRPLLVVLDDVHWAAPAFLDLVESLVELARAPVLVLCLARPDLLQVRPQWGGGRLSSSSVLLDVLTEAESDALLDRLSPEGSVDPAVRERILGVAEGNPLFIEQLLAAAYEGDAEGVPDSIQTLLAARVDRLDDGDRAVLQAAAVCGTSFATDEVAELVELDPSDVAADPRPARARAARRGRRSRRRGLVVPAQPDPGRRVRQPDQAPARRAARAARRIRDRRTTAMSMSPRAITSTELYTRGARPENAGRASSALAARAAGHLGRAGAAAHDQHEMAAAASLLGRANALLPRESPVRIELVPRLAAALVSLGEVAAAQELLADGVLGRRRARRRPAWSPASRSEPISRCSGPTPRLRRSGPARHRRRRSGAEGGRRLRESRYGRRFFDSRRSIGSGCRAGSSRSRVALEYARRADARYLEHYVMGWICITLHRGAVPVDEAIARAREIFDAATSTYVRSSAIGALGVLRAMKGEFDEARACVAEVGVDARRARAAAGERRRTRSPSPRWRRSRVTTRPPSGS